MVTTIRLQQFRSYLDESFEFDPGVNIIVGPNTSGKTNLLEAILMISSGKSYRVRDADTIMHNKDWARIEAFTPDSNRILKIISEPDGTARKSISLNKEEMRIITPQKQMPTVLFEPNHLQLFQLGPDLRRDFLDNLLEQTTPGFATTRKHYKRALLQRNRLLKLQPKDVRQQLFVWNVRLGDLGGHIAARRKDLIARIASQLPELYGVLSHSTRAANILYGSAISGDQYGTVLLHKLEAGIDRDLQRGFTGYGPHRDDLVVTLDNYDIQENASRGETRTILLALKIVELKILEEVFGKKPILLLDDVFSELDGARRRALTGFLSNYQTFITTTDADVVLRHFTDECKIIALG